MLLFLVDGKRTAGEIVAQLPVVGDAALILDALLREGLLALVPSAPPAPARTASDSLQLADAGTAPLPEDDVRQAMAGLTRYLHDALGPEADMISIKIESARSRGEFAQAVRRAIATLQNALGPAEANQFQARAQVILDIFFARR